MKSHNVLKTKHLIRKRMISSTRCGVFLVFALIWGFGFVMGVCNFLSSVSSQQKFEATDQTYRLQMDQCYSSMFQLSFI